MLYKNDEPYKLAPNDVKTINERFHGKWPLTIIYPPERVVPSRSKQNKLPDKPNSMSWPLTATVRTTMGTEQWRYAENVIIKEHGLKKYTPKNIRFNGRRAFEETDIELVWFLYTKSPYCKGGPNAGKTIKFMFEDLITEAEIKAERENVQSTVKVMIYNQDLGLSEARLRALAKAYFIKNVDNLTFPQVKLAIEHQIVRDHKNGYKKFMDMTQMDDLIAARGRIQGLVDKNFLKYDVVKREWLWLEDGKKASRIVKVASGTDPNDSMYDYFMGNKEFQETVDLVEKTKRAKVG